MARTIRKKPAGRARPATHVWDGSYMAAVFNVEADWSPPATVTLTWTKDRIGIYRGTFTAKDGMKARVTVRLRLVLNGTARSVDVLGREISMVWSFKGKL